MNSKTKTPEALAGATGAEKSEAGQLLKHDTSKRSRSAMSLYAKPGHKRAARMLGFSLTLGTSSGWSDFVTVASAWLTDAERAALAFSSLKSLSPQTAAETFNAAFAGTGWPVAVLGDPVAEASFWVDHARPEERCTYLVTIFNTLSKRDRLNFLEYVQEVAA
ncbi:hypothetical protein [Vannielia litorea]|uniref:hypothetical protein n=1 Tax=Vannielia litorea TaxID=1217970 RepID=UPI001BCE48DA|nr:hypothetical protein [Vannielia litorea]MBS8225327.1 hypothetical protein [Vannielia litorea]